MKQKFIFRHGSRVSGVQPEAVGKELARIRRSKGALTSEAVVDEARPEDAVLHPAFEWDDSVAGEEYRLIQARQLIRAVQVVKDAQPPVTVYAFVPNQQQGPGEYDPTETLAQSVDRFALALADAMKHLRSAQDRVDELKRAAGDEPDRVAIITIAAQALGTAEQAMRRLAA